MTRQHITVVYFGTPEYAVPSLRALADDHRFDAALVVTQPDRPAGRGHAPQAPPVKRVAESLGIPTYQPENLRIASSREPLAATGADVFVVAAYGVIFGAETLAIPRYGCLNLHASLLPAFRGASPVTAAILAGDRVSGVSLMEMDLGLDTGPVVTNVEVPIAPTDTTESLTTKLADAGAELVSESLEPYVRGELVGVPQDASLASKVRPLLKADGWLDWGESAAHLERRVRAMWPWPRAWTALRGQPVQIHRATALPNVQNIAGGVIEVVGGETLVGTGEGALRIDVAQSAGGKPLTGAVWARGQRIEAGERLGGEGVPALPSPLITAVERRPLEAD